MVNFKIPNQNQLNNILFDFGYKNLVSPVYYGAVSALEGIAISSNQPLQPLANKFNINNQPKSDLYKYNPNSFSKDLLGQPVWSELYFKDITINNVTYSQKYPIGTCLFTVSQNKNIVKTIIQGQNGTVKQYIADSDFEIKIQGAMFAPVGGYPDAQMKDLQQFCRLGVTLEIVSPFLNDYFNIYNIVIESYDFPQEMGSQSKQPFSLNCCSDTPVEIQLYKSSQANSNTSNYNFIL